MNMKSIARSIWLAALQQRRTEQAEDQELPGLRPITLDEDAARQMEAILADESHPAHSGRDLPAADASVFRKREG